MPEKTGALPDDFPGVSALRDAGITSYGKLRMYGDVTEVPGIGAATEAKIKAALAANGGSSSGGAAVSISAAELADLRRRAAGGGNATDFEQIAKRPYRVIKDSDGRVVCTPPPEGPWTIGGEHPDDYFGVGDDGVATKGV